MIRLKPLLCAIVLLISPYTMLGQHRGQGGGRGAGRPAGASTSDDLKDFKRAIALQASPDQVAQFRQMTKSTEAARKAAQDLLQLASNASKPDLSKNSNDLSSAVEEAQTSNARFLQTFSGAQKSGLKDLTKKLRKADAEITKQSKPLGRAPGRSATDGPRIAGVVEKLDKALGDFQTHQSAIGTEMGIQPESSSKTGGAQ